MGILLDMSDLPSVHPSVHQLFIRPGQFVSGAYLQNHWMDCSHIAFGVSLEALDVPFGVTELQPTFVMAGLANMLIHVNVLYLKQY